MAAMILARRAPRQRRPRGRAAAARGRRRPYGASGRRAARPGRRGSQSGAAVELRVDDADRLAKRRPAQRHDAGRRRARSAPPRPRRPASPAPRPGTVFTARSAPPTASSGAASSTTVARPPTARTSTTSNASRPLVPGAAYASLRAQTTAARPARPAAATAASRNAHFLATESSKVSSADGRATASGMPGTPAPAPRSSQRGPAAAERRDVEERERVAEQQVDGRVARAHGGHVAAPPSQQQVEVAVEGVGLDGVEAEGVRHLVERGHARESSSEGAAAGGVRRRGGGSRGRGRRAVRRRSAW